MVLTIISIARAYMVLIIISVARVVYGLNYY